MIAILFLTCSLLLNALLACVVWAAYVEQKKLCEERDAFRRLADVAIEGWDLSMKRKALSAFADIPYIQSSVSERVH